MGSYGRRPRGWWSVVGAVALIATVSACGSSGKSAASGQSSASASQSSPAKLETVRIGLIQDQPLYGAVWLGQDDLYGTFRKQGIDLKLVYYPTGTAVAAAVFSGDVDLAIGNAAPVISAIDQGQQVSALGSGGTNAQVILASSKLTTTGKAQDLVGKKVGSSGPFSTAMVQEALVQGGLSATAASIVNVTVPGSLPALQAGQIDYLITGDPYVGQAVDQGIGKIWRDFRVETGSLGKVPNTVVWGKTSYLTGNPAIAAGFTKALCQNSNMASANPSQAGASMASKMPGDKASNTTLAAAAAKLMHCEISQEDVATTNEVIVTVGKSAPKTVTYDQFVWSGAPAAWASASGK